MSREAVIFYTSVAVTVAAIFTLAAFAYAHP